jgi:adenosine kinase
MAEGLKDSILGIGNPLLDISAEVKEEEFERWGVKPASAILAEEKHQPLYAQLVKDYPVEYIAGGACQNSIRLAQWMLQAEGAMHYVGCVGKDSFGQQLRTAAEKDGVRVHYLEDDEQVTGSCAVLVHEKERSLVANLAAANCYKKTHLDSEEVQAAVAAVKLVYATGFFLTVSVESLLSLGEHCLQKNKPFCFNLSAEFLINFFADPMQQVLPYVDVLFANELEAAAFGKKQGWGEDLKEVALKTAALPKKNEARDRLVIFTQGKDPSIVAYKGAVTEYAVPAIDPTSIVDTNGAGDSFVGGFLAGYVQQKELADCVRAGNYAASRIIQISGIKPPTSAPDFQWT